MHSLLSLDRRVRLVARHRISGRSNEKWHQLILLKKCLRVHPDLETIRSTIIDSTENQSPRSTAGPTEILTFFAVLFMTLSEERFLEPEWSTGFIWGWGHKIAWVSAWVWEFSWDFSLESEVTGSVRSSFVVDIVPLDGCRECLEMSTRNVNNE